MTHNNKRQNSRFRKGTGCFTCADCGKQTRETGVGNKILCPVCYEKSGWENTHSDMCREDNPTPDCPFCKEAGWVD